MALLNAYVDAEEFFAALVREPGTLPKEAIPLLEKLVALCKGTGAKIAVSAILRDVLPAAARRHQSGFHAIAVRSGSAGDLLTAATSMSRSSVPDLVRVSTPTGEWGFAMPDYEQGAWTRLRFVIETMTVERLLRANGRPLGLKDLPELRGADREVSDVVGAINDQFAGRRRRCFVETCGAAPRGRGQRRKLNPADEPPDQRVFLIHTLSWRIESATLRSLDEIEEPEDENQSELTTLFGVPQRGRAAV